MAKVYLLSSGNYSDYQVHAIYTTRESAAKVAAWMNEGLEEDDWHRADVEERDLDPEFPMPAGTPHIVTLDYPTGDNADVCRVSRLEWTTDYEIPVYFDKPYQQSGRWVIRTMVWADDKTHAIKVANERRQQYRATQGARV